MSYCFNCGNKLEDFASFCGMCGTAVKQTPVPETTVSSTPDSATPVVQPVPEPTAPVVQPVSVPTPPPVQTPVTPTYQQSTLETPWTPVVGEAKSFPILDKNLEVPAELDAFNTYRLRFREVALSCSRAFETEYCQRIFNLDSFLATFMPLYRSKLELLVNKAVDILVAERILTVSRDSFLSQHTSTYHNALDTYNMTVQSFNMTMTANQQKKRSATPYVSPEQRMELYSRINVSGLFNQVYMDYWRVFLTLVQILRQNGKSLWWAENDLSQKANNIYQNIFNPNFPKDKMLDTALEVIRMFPYNANYYKFLLSGMSTPDEVNALKDYFGYYDFNNPRLI